jgi:hypothetical protein
VVFESPYLSHLGTLHLEILKMMLYCVFSSRIGASTTRIRTQNISVDFPPKKGR